MEVNFINDNKGIIDLNSLKDIYLNGRLQEANVFAKLFQLDDNTPFKKEKFNINLFKDFDIELDHWYSLIIFLRTGLIPYQGDKKEEEKVLNNIIQVSVKLGGIPSLDIYYQNFYQEKIKNKKKYNPQNPEEDNRQLFHWKIVSDRSFGIFQKQNNDYQATRIFRMTTSSVTEYVYFRKLKEGVDLSNEYIDDDFETVSLTVSHSTSSQNIDRSDFFLSP